MNLLIFYFQTDYKIFYLIISNKTFDNSIEPI